MSAGDKRRVLHLVASNFVGGPEKQILQHALDMRGTNYEVWVGSFLEDSGRPEILLRAEELGIPTVQLAAGRFNPRAVSQLVTLTRKNSVDLICTYHYKANIAGWLARSSGLTQIASARGFTGEDRRVRFYESLDRFVLNRTEHVACVSLALAESLQKNRRKGLSIPVVIPNSPTIKVEEQGENDRASLRDKLGIQRSAFLIGVVGRLSPEKGHYYLLQAIPELSKRIPQLQVVFVGEGRERQRLEEQVGELKIQDRVTLVGFKKDVVDWIRSCELLVNPSLSEGMPNAVMEAMAVGTPVVATAVGGVPEFVKHGVSGILTPPANSNALLEAICNLYENPEQRHSLANGARESLRHSRAKQKQAFIHLYEKVLGLNSE
ncbi:MAG: glycosyl transferase group 1 [Acidobacteriales bacterium]|nr:glycosyl transferase group 1 [Terriglobales bacterium]